MAKINLTSNELKELSNLMRKWRDDMNNLNSRLRTQIKNMDGWRDPQFMMFLNAIETTSAQLQIYIKNMETMSNSLNLYADQQREINAQFRSQMSSMN